MTSRRDFIKLMGVAGAGALLSGCSGGEQLGWLAGRPTAPAPEGLTWQGTEAERTAARLLNRLAYGARPGDVARVAELGREAFIEQQLNPESLDDRQAHWLTRRIEALQLKTPDIFELPAEAAAESLIRATVLRAVYSQRQLLEVMVEFWSDHFNIFIHKGDCAWLKVIDDRDVIRPHALGRFRDLVRASATSPAMLVYLDGQANRQGQPNENYARELLELHTLGVNGGYSQADVMELARALTGWQVKKRFWRGRANIVDARHDSGDKYLLGKKLAGGAEAELEQAIDILCAHPATAHFISRKLCRRFVADEPSADLIARVARVFSQSDGDIKATLRAILSADEFWQAPPKFKRPYNYMVSALRALGARTDGGRALQQQLMQMGQLPFNWPTPDGYPEGETHWAAQLLPRWNFAIDLVAGKIKGTRVETEKIVKSADQFGAALLTRSLTEDERAVLRETGSDAIALLLCMPGFQYH